MARLRQQVPERVVVVRSHTHGTFWCYEESGCLAVSTPSWKLQDDFAAMSRTPNKMFSEDIEELRSKVPAVDEDGARTEEICLALGLGETTVRKMLRELKAQGRLKVVRRRIEAVDGKLVTVRAYRILAAQGGTGGTASCSG